MDVTKFQQTLSPQTSPKDRGPYKSLSVSTPEFGKSNFQCHQRSFSRETALIKETIDELCKDNKCLSHKIAQIEKSKQEMAIENERVLALNEKNHKAIVDNFEKVIKEKQNLADEYYNQVKAYEREIMKLRSESNSSNFKGFCIDTKRIRKLQSCEDKMNRQFENLIKINDENSGIRDGIEAELSLLDVDESLLRSSLIYEDTYDASAIHEEGFVPKFSQTCFDSALTTIDPNVTQNKIFNSRPSISTFGSNQEDFELCSLGLPGTMQQEDSSIYKKLRKKDEEITRHKNFIRKLKNSLEAILLEHSKSRMENELNRREIKELKQKLLLTLPRNSVD